MKNVALSIVLAGGLAVVAGCQNSGRSRVEVDTRPARADATTNGRVAYTAVNDTTWRSSTAASADTGAISRGTTVYFDRSIDTTQEWQQARLTDGSTRWVRPADFRPASSR